MDDIKQKFEDKKKELDESLRYASCIQQALMPTETAVNQIVKECFIYFKPRDLVSGDFYWVKKKSNLIYIVVGDCTGHGIPGAFLSILGISFLNHIIDNQLYNSASAILNVLREHIMKALNQTGNLNERKDGIDLSLCIINENSGELSFSGAFHSLYILKTNQELIEIGGDKMQIGISADEEQPFTNHVMSVNNGDILYMFTDGFADQFGGPDGKKFKYTNFRNIIKKIGQLSMAEQKEKLEQSFISWKGNHPQLDDILILGLRIHYISNK